MKKFLPFLILISGFLVLAASFFLTKFKINQDKEIKVNEEENLLEIPLENRPIASLTPTLDGHYLNLKVEKILIPAKTLDYEVLYYTSEGIQQGVPGSVDIEGKDFFETDILLGTESSGKFRYDEGVERGTLTLKLRDKEGRLIAKFSTEFLLTKIDSSPKSFSDSDLIFQNLSEKKVYGFLVIMNTFGIPENLPEALKKGPYGIFASQNLKVKGDVKLRDSEKLYYWDFQGREWQEYFPNKEFSSAILAAVGS